MRDGLGSVLWSYVWMSTEILKYTSELKDGQGWEFRLGRDEGRGDGEIMVCCGCTTRCHFNTDGVAAWVAILVTCKLK